MIPWIDEFNKVFGLHEVRDRAELATWLKSDKKTVGDPTAFPWCGDAMDTAINLSLPNEPRHGDLAKNPYWALNWLFFGKETRPCYGAIAVFKRPTGGHVGVVVGEDKDNLRILGGNQSDGVTLTWISKKRCVGYRWPATYKNPNIPIPKLTMNGKLSTNEA